MTYSKLLELNLKSISRFITQVGGETVLSHDDVDFLLNAIGATDQDDISIDQLSRF